jgi:hypothetical protein
MTRTKQFGDYVDHSNIGRNKSLTNAVSESHASNLVEETVEYAYKVAEEQSSPEYAFNAVMANIEEAEKINDALAFTDRGFQIAS